MTKKKCIKEYHHVFILPHPLKSEVRSRPFMLNDI